MDEPTMHIGELAEQTGLSLRTIRHYDEVGLLKPSARTEGGFRLYTRSDLERLLLIRRMKPLGFALDDMVKLLEVMDSRAAGKNDDPAIAALLAGYLAGAEDRRATLQSQLEMADEFIARLKQL